MLRQYAGVLAVAACLSAWVALFDHRSIAARNWQILSPRDRCGTGPKTLLLSCMSCLSRHAWFWPLPCGSDSWPPMPQLPAVAGQGLRRAVTGRRPGGVSGTCLGRSCGGSRATGRRSVFLKKNGQISLDEVVKQP